MAARPDIATRSKRPSAVMAFGRPRSLLSDRWTMFFLAVVAIQGVHVFEHVVQLLQTQAFGVPSDDALGVLGYLVQFNGTEEYLHFGFNLLYVAAITSIGWPLWRVRASLPKWAVVFFFASVWVETVHMVEHVVILSNTIANSGCPCPGIGDQLTGLPDEVLHFFYNVFAYSGVVTAYVLLTRRREPRG